MSEATVTLAQSFAEYAKRLETDFPHWTDDFRINEAHPTVGEIKQIAQMLSGQPTNACADSFQEAQYTRWLMQQPMTGWPK